MVLERFRQMIEGVGASFVLALSIFVGDRLEKLNTKRVTTTLGILFLFIFPVVFITFFGWKFFFIINGIMFFILIIFVAGLLGFIRAVDKK